MLHNDLDLLDIATPRIFADGTEFFHNLSQKYTRHSKGLFLLAPSGTGKTYFTSNQSAPDWIDGDELWMGANAHPKGEWWKERLDTIITIDERCDVITKQAKNLGYWIMGSSNVWLTPDAIVIPDWETHKQYIAARETHNYDGGATVETLDNVKVHREWILKTYGEKVPCWKSIQEAVDNLTS